MRRALFVWRQLTYDAGTSLLAVPLTLVVLIGTLALLLERLEAWGGGPDWLGIEPATAQATLATLAGSMMTVVSVVYSVLLVALSMSSVQFSTRILSGMVRDPVSQGVLGLFLGTFTWQLVALRAVHVDPPHVPPFTVAIALLLAVASLGALVLFIDRVIHMIQANHLVDRIASRTEGVIDEVFPPVNALGEPAPCDTTWPAPPAGAALVPSDRSGYIQLVSLDEALAVAQTGLQVHLTRPMGSFVPRGGALWRISPPERCTPEVMARLRAAVDVGPIRTMQQDVEWGLRQIVDIGLKAISPAVNDPSTAATCIDHLSRLLIRAGQRAAPPSVWEAAGGELVVPGPRYSELVDLAFEQIRQYGKSDMAIALRLLRAMADVAEVVRHPEGRARIASHVQQVEAAARAAFPAEDCDELGRRAQRVRLVLET
jgi:uncharacterized membrane protein